MHSYLNLEKGLEAAMGFFGTTGGHTDDGNDTALDTTFIHENPGLA